MKIVFQSEQGLVQISGVPHEHGVAELIRQGAAAYRELLAADQDMGLVRPLPADELTTEGA